jgi:hypothetical protein
MANVTILIEDTNRERLTYIGRKGKTYDGQILFIIVIISNH